MNHSKQQPAYSTRLQDPNCFIEVFKDALHGYTAKRFNCTHSYQDHLTKLQLRFKKMKNSTKGKGHFQIVEEIILDFNRIDYDGSVNMSAIRDRIGNEALWEIYVDFKNRIRVGKVDEMIFEKELRFLMGEPSNRDIRLLHNIKKQMMKFAPKVEIRFIQNLLQNIPPRQPLVWAGGQYAFDYFIRRLPCLSKQKYKDAIQYYLTFPSGPAYVRTGGGFEKTHMDKQYKEPIDIMINDINNLFISNKRSKIKAGPLVITAH